MSCDRRQISLEFTKCQGRSGGRGRGLHRRPAAPLPSHRAAVALAPPLAPAIWSGGALPLDDGVYRPTGPQPQVWPAATPQRPAGVGRAVGQDSSAALGDAIAGRLRSWGQDVSRAVDSLGGPQPEPVTATNPVVRWAQAHVGRGGYGKWLDVALDARGPVADWGAVIRRRGMLDPKCNQFVWDALTGAHKQPGRIDGGRIPRAKDWGDPQSQIPGYAPITGPLQPGDVVSNGDHVGIYAPLPNGAPGTISAASPFHNGGLLGGVVHNDWGFRGDEGPKTAWRYIGLGGRR